MSFNSRHRLTSAALSCLAFISVADKAAAEPTTQIRSDHTKSCQYFYTHCQGTQDSFSINFKNDKGELEFGVTEFGERDQNTFFDRTFHLGHAGHIRGLGQWGTQAEGLKVYASKQFYLGDHAGISIGGYAGKISASINLDARLDLHTRAFHIDMPGFQVPAVPALGISARDISARQINIPEYHRTLASDHRHAAAQSPYGGLTLDSGYGYSFTPQVTGIIGQTATAGFDGIWGGLNAGVILSSNAHHDTRAPLGNICQGQPVFPKQGFNVVANVCVRKDFKHPLYDLEKKKAGEIGSRISNRLADIAHHIEEETGYRPSTPVYSADRVLDILGIESPYKLQTSLQFSIAGRMGDILLSAGIKQPLGKDKNTGRTINASVGYEF